jgi:hypothetical protein
VFRSAPTRALKRSFRQGFQTLSWQVSDASLRGNRCFLV